MRAYLADLIRELPVSPNQHRIAMAQYSDSVHIEFHIDQKGTSSDMTNHIWNRMTHIGGNTNAHEALLWAKTYLNTVK